MLSVEKLSKLPLLLVTRVFHTVDLISYQALLCTRKRERGMDEFVVCRLKVLLIKRKMVVDI